MLRGVGGGDEGAGEEGEGLVGGMDEGEGAGPTKENVLGLRR